MSDFNQRVHKYRATFEIELYGASPREGYARALKMLTAVVEKHHQLHLEEVFDRLSLPSGGLEGAPHGDTLDGWHCFYELAELGE